MEKKLEVILLVVVSKKTRDDRGIWLNNSKIPLFLVKNFDERLRDSPEKDLCYQSDMIYNII